MSSSLHVSKALSKDQFRPRRGLIFLPSHRAVGSITARIIACQAWPRYAESPKNRR
jgi:hypothetical protein